MSETKYEVLARMDAAILFFEDSARNLREIKQQWLEAHEEQRDEPPTPATAYKKPIMLRQLLVVDTVIRLQKLSGENPTFSEVVEVVWPQYPRGKLTRDQRKTNAERHLREAIAAGHLIKNKDDEVSLPGVCYL